eukprot:g24776.t1
MEKCEVFGHLPQDGHEQGNPMGLERLCRSLGHVSGEGRVANMQKKAKPALQLHGAAVHQQELQPRGFLLGYAAPSSCTS